MLHTLNLILQQKSPTKFLTQKEFIALELSVILLIVILVSNIIRGTSYADTTTVENFSVMGTVNNIATTTLSLINANGSDGSGYTSYILDISNVDKIENQNYIPLTISDINVGDSVIAQGLDTNGIFSISRIISLTSTSTVVATNSLVATSTATTTVSTDTSVATSTNGTLNSDILLTSTSTSNTDVSTSTASTTNFSVSTDASSTPIVSATTTDTTASSTPVLPPAVPPDVTTPTTTPDNSTPPDSTGSTTP